MKCTKKDEVFVPYISGLSLIHRSLKKSFRVILRNTETKNDYNHKIFPTLVMFPTFTQIVYTSYLIIQGEWKARTCNINEKKNMKDDQVSKKKKKVNNF